MFHSFGVEPLYIFSGLLVGFLVGLTGVGGGSLMTPLLILLFGIHPSTAVGTDLLYAAVTKTVGSAVHHSGKSIQWKIVGLLALGSVPATIVVIALLSRLGAASPAVNHLISLVLGAALLLSALLLVLKGLILRVAIRRNPDFGLKTSASLTIITGLVLGVLVSISSVGAGALGTIALVFLYPRLPTVKIVGTDIAHAVPLTLLAGLGHWWLGSINFSLLGSLLLGSIPGILLGSYVVRWTPEPVLRPILAVVLALVGTKMLAS